MKNKLLTIIFLLSLSHHQMVFSQQNVIPPDPIVEAMTVFGDIPVSHMTGVPDISIPLFTLESHGYKLPIVLKYHTALVKPPYDHTNISTGWVLDVGGEIVQQVKGSMYYDDLHPHVDNPERKNTIELSDQTKQDVQDYLFHMTFQNNDYEHDMFKYSLPGKSGEFIITKNVAQDLVINYLSEPNFSGNVNTNGLPRPPIEIIDDKGYTYEYGNTHTSNKLSITGNIVRYLEKIISPHGVELFKYDYDLFSNLSNWHQFSLLRVC